MSMKTEYWKLGKALYSLKQARDQWFRTLCEILGTLGMHQLIGDEGTYTNRDHSILIGTHVDDPRSIMPTEKSWTMARVQQSTGSS